MFRNVVADSVNGAWPFLCQIMEESRGFNIESPSRNGKVRTSTDPVTLTLNKPNYRVLNDPRRNANPVFHLVEALWMLAGSNNVEFIRYYNKQMYTYSDDGVTFNAAYGHRWRNHFGQDQLLRCRDMIKANPHDRRVVMSMWDPREDLGSASLDIPCNTQVMFRVIHGALHMTTVNRSNDLVWGLMGANCVHLTIMQEWMAAATGSELGAWHHMTNNLHVYEQHWEMLRRVSLVPDFEYTNLHPSKLVQDPMRFLAECEALVAGKQDFFEEPFFDGTVAPMVQSWDEYKGGNIKEALHLASCIDADDWRYATIKWYERAKEKRDGS